MSPDNQCLKFDIDESPGKLFWGPKLTRQLPKVRHRGQESVTERERGGDCPQFLASCWTHLLTTACRVLTSQHIHVHVHVVCSSSPYVHLHLLYCKCVTFGLSWVVIVILSWHVAMGHDNNWESERERERERIQIEPFLLIAATHLAVVRTPPVFCPLHIIFLPKLLRSLL